jgi:hypothetical protein
MTEYYLFLPKSSSHELFDWAIPISHLYALTSLQLHARSIHELYLLTHNVTEIIPLHASAQHLRKVIQVPAIAPSHLSSSTANDYITQLNFSILTGPFPY